MHVVVLKQDALCPADAPELAGSSIGGHANAKRPRLTVQIPGESGSVEPELAQQPQQQSLSQPGQRQGDNGNGSEGSSRQQRSVSIVSLAASSQEHPTSPKSLSGANDGGNRPSGVGPGPGPAVRAKSRTPLPLPAHESGSGSMLEATDGHVVLPRPTNTSPTTTGPLLSAGAQGPSNPFARPHLPPASTAASAATSTAAAAAAPATTS
ncbi:hypothetical protein KEM52_004768, partial [Ascosphaera acerosa]